MHVFILGKALNKSISNEVQRCKKYYARNKPHFLSISI